MVLLDKNNILENNIHNNNSIMIIDKIDNYFDNYLNSNIKSVISEYINQFVYFKNSYDNDILDKININIDDKIKDFIIQRRNNIRQLIKKNNYNLNSYNKFINEFIIKLSYIIDIIKINNNIINNAITYFIDYIINDCIILVFIENQITSFSKINEINKFIDYIKKIDKLQIPSNNNLIYQIIIKNFSDIFKKEILIDKINPLPDNIKQINKFNNNINYYLTLTKYYENIFNDLMYYIIPILLDNFINIIKFNSISEIEFIMNKKFDIVNIIINNFYINKDEYIKQIVIELSNLIKKYYNKKNIISIINILSYFNNIINNKLYTEIINNEFFNNFDNSVTIYDNELINIIYDKKFFKSKYISYIINFLKYLINIYDKELFINIYEKYLTNRLFQYIVECDSQYDFTMFIKNEIKIFNFLKKKLGDKYVYKINKMISDIQLSYYDQNIINNKKNIIINISYNNWNINYNDGIIYQDMILDINNTILGNYMIAYNEYFILKNSQDNKILNWYLHYGEVEITYLNQTIKMLPIQFLIMEMFNTKDSILVDDILNIKYLSNYSDKFRKDIINSLLLSGLFIINNKYLVLSTNNSEFKDDLITIIFSESEYIYETKLEELALTQKDIIMANINHNLKLNTLNYDDLFNNIINNIKVIDIDKNIFNSVIIYMTDMDYIKLNNNNKYEKIYY